MPKHIEEITRERQIIVEGINGRKYRDHIISFIAIGAGVALNSYYVTLAGLAYLGGESMVHTRQRVQEKLRFQENLNWYTEHQETLDRL